jgi:hypothetical protein
MPQRGIGAPAFRRRPAGPMLGAPALAELGKSAKSIGA